MFGPPGQRVQVILPDLRYNRTAMLPMELNGASYEAWAEKRVASGLPLPGPYVRNPDPRATMLGERQWQWLERQLEVPAEIRLFGSSVQVLADFTGWEAWANFARDQDRLFDVIRRKRANGVLFLSGDIHYAELSKREVNVPYPLWDLTSSGLTEEWRVPTPNANRASEVVADANFGYIDIDWRGAATMLALGIVDATGRTRMSWNLPLARPGRARMSPAPVRAALFDLDGTLVDSEIHTDTAIRVIAERHGIAGLRAAAHRDPRPHLGARRARSCAPAPASQPNAAALADELLAYWTDIAADVTPVPGAPEAIREAATRLRARRRLLEPARGDRLVPRQARRRRLRRTARAHRRRRGAGLQARS